MFIFMWGRLAACGGLATRLERRLPGYPLGRAQLDKLPHKCRLSLGHDIETLGR